MTHIKTPRGKPCVRCGDDDFTPGGHCRPCARLYNQNKKPPTSCPKCGGRDINKQGACRPCRSRYMKGFRADNKEYIAEYDERYRKNNRESINATRRKRERTPEARKKSRMMQFNYRETRRDKVSKQQVEYQKRYPEKHLERTRRYSASKLRAVPPWYERSKVTEVYRQSKLRGFHVDHIVPLNSDQVCGLHCWDNLQLLDKRLNSIKGNHIWPDMWDIKNLEIKL